MNTRTIKVEHKGKEYSVFFVRRYLDGATTRAFVRNTVEVHVATHMSFWRGVQGGGWRTIWVANDFNPDYTAPMGRTTKAVVALATTALGECATRQAGAGENDHEDQDRHAVTATRWSRAP